jgi:hypothetical protein
MRPLSVQELLSVWEQGLAQGPVERALVLLTVACPESDRDTLAKMSIGHRDAILLTLREWTFGPRMAGIALCSKCGQKPELEFRISDIRVNFTPEPTDKPEPEIEVALTLTDYAVRFRAPNSLDLAAVSAEVGPIEQRQTLFERCLIVASRNSKAIAADQLPPEVVDAVEERLAQADPQADVQLDISCPFCGGRSRVAFDIVAFFWREIETWAQRTLRDVDALASAYGWSENDILSLSPVRRQFYLEMIGA